MTDERNDRATSGRFASGNAGGPGRPPRIVERDYLRALSQACTLDVWREICETAVAAARSGDSKAREFLARNLLGPQRGDSLIEVAAWDEAGRDPVAVRVKELGILSAL